MYADELDLIPGSDLRSFACRHDLEDDNAAQLGNGPPGDFDARSSKYGRLYSGRA